MSQEQNREEERNYLVLTRHGQDGMWVGFSPAGSKGATIGEARGKMEDHFRRGRDARIVKVVEESLRDHDSR